MIATLIQLALLFGGFSLLAFGGGTAVIPDMQRVTVNTYHWVTAPEFLAFFAISRAAPGPGPAHTRFPGNPIPRSSAAP